MTLSCWLSIEQVDGLNGSFSSLRAYKCMFLKFYLAFLLSTDSLLDRSEFAMVQQLEHTRGNWVPGFGSWVLRTSSRWHTSISKVKKLSQQPQQTAIFLGLHTPRINVPALSHWSRQGSSRKEADLSDNRNETDHHLPASLWLYCHNLNWTRFWKLP